MDLSLDSLVQYLPKVGPTMAERLGGLGIATIEDLLNHIPFRYDDFTHTVPLNAIKPDTTVTVRGTVLSFRNIFTKNGKKMQEAILDDTKGRLTILWFNQLFLSRVITPGTTLFLAGKVDWFGKKIAMISPTYEIVEPTQTDSLHAGRLVPIYPLTEGLTMKWLRTRVASALASHGHLLTEILPESVVQTHALMPRPKAIHTIHFPETLELAQAAKRRLAFEELFIIQLASLAQKYERQRTTPTARIPYSASSITDSLGYLPFALTPDQLGSVHDIAHDMDMSYPMQRILIGDVGSGKTVVAAIAMILAAKAGHQSVFMAPTQILAEQHFATISKILDKAKVTAQLITSTHKFDPSKKTDIYIGTHALLSQPLHLPHLGLAIIDEQQRFGVVQRELLTQKGSNMTMPHVLTMTATPIPRTVAHTLFGNIDLSILGSLPTGRKRVKTWVVSAEKRKKAYEWIAQTLAQSNGQAFIVCPLIEESESQATVKSAKNVYEDISSAIFPHFSVGLLHGRMKPKEKSEILEKFAHGEIDILVTTPVVEVGIDIPNSVIMMIEGADRFGLAQLHQLRGRVGRGEKQSYCLLFTENDTDATLTRLKAMETIYNGPELAELDFSLRGGGDLFGTRQHGLPSFRVASLTDMPLLKETHTAAVDFISRDPTLASFPLLSAELKKGTITQSIST